MDFWSILQNLFGIGDLPSPRDSLLSSAANNLLKPVTPDIYTQQYFDLLSIVFVTVLPLLMIEFVIRAIGGIKNENLGQEMLEWGKTLLFALVVVPLLPGAVLAVKGILDEFNSWMFEIVAGTSNPAQIAKMMSELTGNGGLDFFLNIVQTVFLFILFLQYWVVFGMVFVTPLILLIGIFFRFAGDLGVTIFKFSTMFAIVTLVANVIIGFVFLVDFLMQSLAADNQLAKGSLNTVAIFAASLVVWKTIGALRSQIVAVGSSAASTMRRTQGKFSRRGSKSSVYDETSAEGYTKSSRHRFARRQETSQNRQKQAAQNDGENLEETQDANGKNSGMRSRGNRRNSSGNRGDESTPRKNFLPRRSSTDPGSTAERSRPRPRSRTASDPGVGNNRNTDGRSAVTENALRRRSNDPGELNSQLRSVLSTSVRGQPPSRSSSNVLSSPPSKQRINPAPAPRRS